jgi:hypothetical protein
MAERVGPTFSVFEIKGRGCVVALELKTLSPDVVLAPGDAIELRPRSGKTIRTIARDIGPMRGPGGDSLGVLLGKEITADMVPGGAEMWKLEPA